MYATLRLDSHLIHKVGESEKKQAMFDLKNQILISSDFIR